jgi:predicted small secreted protein
MRKTIASVALTLFALTAAATVLSACNTVEGVGKDTSAAGRAISDTSREVRR